MPHIQGPFGKPHRKKISVHLGIARLGGGLNPCQDGLWHLFLGEMSDGHLHDFARK